MISLASVVCWVRSHVRMLVIVGVLFGMGLIGGLALPVAAWFAPERAIPGSPSAVQNPEMVVDSNGRVHVIWLDDRDQSDRKLNYIRGTLNADGSDVAWESVQVLDADQTPYPRANPRIAVDASGGIHIAYATDKDFIVRYLYNPAAGNVGAWISEIITPVGVVSINEMDITTDSAGTPYVVWGQGEGQSSVQLAYRVAPNSWTVRRYSNVYALVRYSRVAVQGAGEGARVHVIYEYREDQNGGLSKGRVSYAYGSRNGEYTDSNLHNRLALTNEGGIPAIAHDPVTGVVTLIFNQNYGKDLVGMALTRTTDGATLTPAAQYQTGVAKREAGEAHIVTVNNIVHIAYRVKDRTVDDAPEIAYYWQFDGNSNQFVGEPTANTLSTLPDDRFGVSRAAGVRIGCGPSGIIVVWALSNTVGPYYNVTPGSCNTGGIVPPPPPPPPTATPIPGEPTPIPAPTPAPRTVSPPPAAFLGRIVFSSTRDGGRDLYVMNVDGSELTRLTNGEGENWDAAFAPDGTQIVFASNRADNDYELFVMQSDGSNVRRLTNSPGVDTHATWYPDGQRILFEANRNGNTDLYTLDLANGSETRLTTDPAADERPHLSPDGTRIAFQSNRDGNHQIYVMNADGTGVQRLTNDAADDTLPAWSPDGSKLAFASRRDGDSEIFVMNADGSGLIQITRNTALDDYPVWSPDGQHLLLHHQSDPTSDYELHYINADGSGEQALLFALPNGDDGNADWSRQLTVELEPRAYLPFVIRR